MAEQDEIESPGVKGSGLAFEPEGDLSEGVPVGDQTPQMDRAKNVEEKGGGPIGVQVPEEKD
jgi:hypothetical protein